jgi:tetratricopeptide (TPR) repeat protein
VLRKKPLPVFFVALWHCRRQVLASKKTEMLRTLQLCSLSLTLCFFPESTRAQSDQNREMDRLFQAAVASYESGKFAEAVPPLEKLVHEAPDNFEVHELLGLVYAAQLQHAKANPHLAAAVRLKPDSVAARSNLAASFAELGKMDRATEEFARAAELDPRNFDTNHNLGEAYVHGGQLVQAIPYLEKAQTLNPAAYDNGYDLALAYLVSGRLADARRQAQLLLKIRDTAELHNLLARIEEKDGQFVAAANQFEVAARLDTSEGNTFDWGGELLVHRTLDPAVQVFERGVKLFPKSQRMMVGLGMAYYARGNYDEAVRAFIQGADLDPFDVRCYQFLSRAYDSSPGQAADVIERFRRFAELQPGNGQALYYYAMSLWKGKRTQDPDLDLKQIESLLKQAIAVNPKLAEGHLQLGNLNADQGKFAAAIPEYQTAVKLNDDLADAHYRLGQAYVRTGQKDLAQAQFDVYQKLRAQHLADLDKQRADIRQFVYSSKEVGKESAKETATP